VATDLIVVDPEQPRPEAIRRAADAIRRGEVVAIPTDALYTLVADPYYLRAVGRVFAAKGREEHRSLPILVSDFLMSEDLASELPNRFYLLARRFWPGPAVLPLWPDHRWPKHRPLALRQSRAKLAGALIEHLGQPLIATSANISGQPTCRSGIETFVVLDGRIDLVLDGGALAGTWATTVDITEPSWRLVRVGAIPEKEIAECLKQS
jgi:L-threonylcarbamoyladenylate synthase